MDVGVVVGKVTCVGRSRLGETKYLDGAAETKYLAGAETKYLAGAEINLFFPRN